MTHLLLALIVFFSPLASYAQGASDTEPPSEVANVAVSSVGNGEITLSWDAATDTVGVVGYRINYGTDAVTATEGEYTEFLDIDNVTEYSVTGLTNGTPYYFSVTAFDTAGNESAYYSNEASATPAAAQAQRSLANASSQNVADTTAPIILSADALSLTTVKIVFSEAVSLPTRSPETAFSIQLSVGLDTLDVLSTELDAEDEEGKTVLLTIESQTPDAVYLLTASSAVTDTAGNPIISGTSDTAPFRGYTEPEDFSPELDQDPPAILSAEAKSETEVHVVLSEPITLPEDPTTTVSITNILDPEFTTELSAVELDETKTVLLVITSEPLPGETQLVLTVSGVYDDAGNLISSNPLASTASFITLPTRAVAVEDTTPPEDATNFATAFLDGLVRLTWTASVNSARDLADQVLYRSNDGGATFTTTDPLGPVVSEHEVSGLIPGQTYTFKLTAKDDSGNESAGVFADITLPETGAGLSLLILASLGLGRLASKRR